MFFTNEQMVKMLELQKILDNRIIEEKCLEGADLRLEKHLALKCELFEMANEIKSFKFWKNKSTRKNRNVLKESVDVLHFLLSIALDDEFTPSIEEIYEVTNMEEEDFMTDVEKYDMNELIGIMDAMMSDMFMEKDTSTINILLIFLCVIVHKSGYTSEDMFKEYIAKNEINHVRQDKNY